ncbi:YsnF/AvaK domain-containing protein [Sphaerothrix gracilis]|uniref:YsnF/AvaK domain-containing protein n=1 Tax=Sphaerothrix gracilis TaxID=3151835 RepID=UPI0031FD2DAD
MKSHKPTLNDDGSHNPEILSTAPLAEPHPSPHPAAPAEGIADARAPETSVRLLQERLKVNRDRRKVGEVVVRKVIETRMVEVPVRREKLIVEQVTPEHQPLAEIDLGEGQISGLELQAEDFTAPARATTDAIASGNLLTIQAATWLLHTVTQQAPQICERVSVTLSLRIGAQTETIYCEFLTPQTAERSLAAMATALFEQCSNVYLELALTDACWQPQIQSWFNRYQMPPNEA